MDFSNLHSLQGAETGGPRGQSSAEDDMQGRIFGRRGRGSWALGLIIGALAIGPMAAVPLAGAQDMGDRSEVERKKKEREEAEKARAAMEVKESDEQREARERMEKREANIDLAKKKFADAAVAAAKRQNEKGLDLMTSAWYLDPFTIDYPLNTAKFAEALGRTEIEFRALAATKVLAKRNLSGLSDESPRKAFLEEALAHANSRLDVVQHKLSVGTLQVSVEPAACEIFVEGAFVGVGTGEIDTITGQRKVETKCAGFFDYEQFVNVRVGDPTSAKVKPNPIPYFGRLILKVDPADGVTVFLDDVPVQQRMAEKPTKEGAITGAGSRENPIQLAARKWVLRFAKDGYDRWHRRIDIRRDQTLLIDARLESLAELEAEKSGVDKVKPDAPKDASKEKAGKNGKAAPSGK